MPNNPMTPQPPILEPGKQLPEQEIRNPGRSDPARDADPDPLPDPDQDDLLDDEP